jgi:hypothetical protein
LPLAYVGDKKVKRFHFSEIIGRLPYVRATVTGACVAIPTSARSLGIIEGYHRTPRDARSHVTHENPEFIEYSINHKSTNMGSIEEALAALDLLEPGERPNYTEVAKTYGVHRSTLSQRHRGVQQSREAQYEAQSNLSHQQSKQLIQ